MGGGLLGNLAACKLFAKLVRFEYDDVDISAGKCDGVCFKLGAVLGLKNGVVALGFVERGDYLESLGVRLNLLEGGELFLERIKNGAKRLTLGVDILKQLFLFLVGLSYLVLDGVHVVQLAVKILHVAAAEGIEYGAHRTVDGAHIVVDILELDVFLRHTLKGYALFLEVHIYAQNGGDYRGDDEECRLEESDYEHQCDKHNAG